MWRIFFFFFDNAPKYRKVRYGLLSILLDALLISTVPASIFKYSIEATVTSFPVGAENQSDYWYQCEVLLNSSLISKSFKHFFDCVNYLC